MFYDFIIMVIGCLFPAFASYNSLTETPDENVDWIKYWIVFGFFNAMSFVTGSLESWLPFLAGLKLVLVCWMQPSLGAGYQMIYDTMLDPLLRRNKVIIQTILNAASSMSSFLLREVIKMGYSLVADMVEHCWQMNLNADDFHVTPRLQMAVNEVIAELRAARQSVGQLPSSNSNVATTSAMAASCIRNCPRNQSTKNLNDNDDVDAMPPIAMSTPNNKKMIIEDEGVRIQLANVASARLMQCVHKYASVEHLVPSRKSSCFMSDVDGDVDIEDEMMKSQSDFDLDVNEMPSVEDLSDSYF